MPPHILTLPVLGEVGSLLSLFVKFYWHSIRSKFMSWQINQMIKTHICKDKFEL